MLVTDVGDGVLTKIQKLSPTRGHQYNDIINSTVAIKFWNIRTKRFSIEKIEDDKKPNPRIRECQRG